MTKIPYGLELESESEQDSGWQKLETICEYLQDQEALPPYLARWLGDAIERSEGDPNELLRRLELKKRRGRQRTRFSAEDELKYGGMICGFEDDGLSPEEALTAIDEQFHGNGPSRSLLQKWRDSYKRALDEAHATK